MLGPAPPVFKHFSLTYIGYLYILQYIDIRYIKTGVSAVLEKSFVNGNMVLLILKLLESEDMYGYQMIETLKKRSDNTFHLKAGSLYPLLHGLEEKGCVTTYEQNATAGKPRRYYHLTDQGHCVLNEKEQAWNSYVRAVSLVLEGDGCCVRA